MKRISFDEFDAARIFEWKLALEQGLEKEGKPMFCICCPPIRNRLAQFIGKPEENMLRREVKKNPYFAPKKKQKTNPFGEREIKGIAKKSKKV